MSNKENGSIFKYLSFTKEIVKRDIKKKYYKSALGIVWTVLNPLLSMLVMAFVFSALFKRNIENYPVYLLCGQLVFSFISGAGRLGMDSIIGSADLIRQLYIPKYVFVFSKVVQSLVDLLFSMIALFIVMLVTGAPITPYLLLLPLLMTLMFAFAMGLALILATYGTFFRDINHLYGIATTLWMWLSAIFYPTSILGVEYQFVFDINPAYQYIYFMRCIVYEGVMPPEKTLLITAAYAVITLLMGIFTFKENENKFMLYI